MDKERDRGIDPSTDEQMTALAEAFIDLMENHGVSEQELRDMVSACLSPDRRVAPGSGAQTPGHPVSETTREAAEFHPEV